MESFEAITPQTKSLVWGRGMTIAPRVLVTIPHYASSKGDQRYGSAHQGPERRAIALTRCVTALHQVLGQRQGILELANRQLGPANYAVRADIDVVICTVGDNHLLERVPFHKSLYTHEPTEIENPLYLGFECHRVLRDRLGSYDWYAYMEDDLVLHDPMFVAKLAWFQQQCGSERLLMPNRFEVSFTRPDLHKAFVDGDLSPSTMEKFLLDGTGPDFTLNLMGVEVRISRALNPHSGCFFLSQEQMRRWVDAPYFLDRDATFAGPLESAATLGPLRTFKIYKPHPSYGSFLEIEHAGSVFLEKVGPASNWKYPPNS